MLKLSEEDMSKAKIGQKLGLLSLTAKLSKIKEKFLKEMGSATPINTWMLRNYTEKVLAVRVEDQASQNTPLSQSLIQSKALTLFGSLKAKRVEEAAEKKFEASRDWFMSFQERSYLH